MKLSFRVVTFLIALLVAGKEVVAFGLALSPSKDVSWSAREAFSNDHWVLENEIEEETDDRNKDDFDAHDFSVSPVSYFRQIHHLLGSCLFINRFYFLVRHTEFYIYVLNLRL